MRGLFRGWHRALRSHRGYDAGALAMARDLAAAMHAPLVASTGEPTSRRPQSIAFQSARLVGRLSLAELRRKLRVVQRHYAPYRRDVSTIVDDAVQSGRTVIHLSSHSFTPVLNGQVRTSDVGLLYDPARPGETVLAELWKAAFAERAPELRVRRNYPYAGKGDGLTRSLRRSHPPGRYVGIEVEPQPVIRAGRRKTVAGTARSRRGDVPGGAGSHAGALACRSRDVLFGWEYEVKIRIGYDMSMSARSRCR
jgi:predicted N-formylglutamate amidohydrolase